MLLQPIADRLDALAGAGIMSGGFRKVAGAANFAAAREDLKNPPAAYVMPLRGKAGPNRLIGMNVHQQVTEMFAVIIAVDNKRDVRGDAVNAALEPLRNATISALLGFPPAADYDPVVLESETLLDLDVTTLYWQIAFMTGYYERKV
jgi:hypothetical protein